MGIWRALIGWYFRSRVAQAVSAVLAFVAAVGGYGMAQRARGKSEGREAAAGEMRDADQKRAEGIRDRVDAARSGGVRGAKDRRGYRD